MHTESASIIPTLIWGLFAFDSTLSLATDMFWLRDKRRQIWIKRRMSRYERKSIPPKRWKEVGRRWRWQRIKIHKLLSQNWIVHFVFVGWRRELEAYEKYAMRWLDLSFRSYFIGYMYALHSEYEIYYAGVYLVMTLSGNWYESTRSILCKY